MEELKQEQKNTLKKKNKVRRRLVLLFLLLVISVSYISFRGEFLQISEINKDYLDVFKVNLIYKTTIFIINFIILFIIISFTNRGIKKGLIPFFEQEKKEMPKLPNKSLAFVISIIVSAITLNWFNQNIMLFLNTTSFGINDPLFNQDIGYFMFQKPCIEMIILYYIFLIIGITIYMTIYYIISFNKFFDGIDRAILKQSRLLKKIYINIKLLSIGIATLILTNTQNIVLEKFLTIDDKTNTVIYGAGFTDVTIKLYGYIILSFVIIVSIFKAIKYFKEQKTKKVIISLLIVPGYLIGLFIVMTGFQLFVVNPNEYDKEKKYIGYNIENTKKAYNINIEEKDIENSGTITLEQIEKNDEVLNNTAIVSKDITLDTLQEKQTNSKYYSYRDTQIGKYNINGNNKLVYISPREVTNENGLTYNNKTYEYTHGFGAIVTSAVSTDLASGNIEYIQKDFQGLDKEINISEPRIYFGMETSNIVVTNSKNKKEFDYPISETENKENTYNGAAGLKLNFIDRLVLGINKGDIKLALSREVTNQSKILINRNIIKRAEKIMPYIIYDENPYQVIKDDGKMVWVIDGYTISNNYPYSQTTVIERNGSKQKINYIRNSVKIIVDSYNGDVKFYITDRTDPIIMAYNNIYPTLFKNKDEKIEADISKHIIYSEFLYNIQSKMLEIYHNVKTDVLYRNTSTWERATQTTSKTLKTTGKEIEPYYTMVKTIDNQSSELGLVLPYTLYGKQNLISYLVGTCDNNINGKLTLYKFSNDSNVLGPMQLDTQIEQDEKISKEIKSLNVTGTKLIRNMIIIPIDNTLLYVEPIYQVMLNETQIPTLKKIIVASGNKVAIGKDLKEALKNLSSQYAINIEVSNTDNVNDLIQSIVKANNNLENSNKNGNWEMIGKDMTNLQELINKLEILLEKEKKTTNNIQEYTNNVLNENNIVE